jgi:hypothetical protein
MSASEAERYKGSASVYRSLFPSDSKNADHQHFHFFEKEYTYTSHGTQAHAIASRFYTTGNVIKLDQGLDTVEVGTKMLGSILRALLQERCSVSIWTKTDVNWEITRSATPGNWAQVESILGMDASNAVSAPAFGCVNVWEDVSTGESKLGIAVVSTSTCEVTLFEAIGCTEVIRYVSKRRSYNTCM